MSLFCLVHGSTQDASGWTRLVSELQKRGHGLVCADLPADEPDASGSRYAQAIAEKLRNSGEAPIVVAHSVSGIFLPLLPAYCPVSENGLSCRLRSRNRQKPDAAATGKSRNVLAGLDR